MRTLVLLVVLALLGLLAVGGAALAAGAATDADADAGAGAGAGAGTDAGAATDVDADRIPFSHAVHKENDDTIACVDCHDATQTAAGKPTLRFSKCADCHDEIPAVLSRSPSQRLAFPVDHRPHAAVACTSCHARRDAPDDYKAPEHQLVVTSRDCFTCHAGSKGAPREAACISCHGRNERRERPETHALAWRTSHGRSSLAQQQAPHAQTAQAGASHGQRCTLCHKESSCRSCHRVEEPRDHNAFWSERTHGVAASFDRQRCQTCHETGQCIGCHRATEPRNHTGAWRATHGLVARSKSDTSCATCHRQSFCADCHRGGR